MDVIGYHAMRLRWCRLALVSFLRRWGVYLVVGAMVVGAGANSPVHAVAGVAAWTVMPIFGAAARGAAWLLPACALQALLALACIWGLRSLLWPARWREAEAALPIAATARRRSDVIVVAVALLPLLLLQAAGSVAMLAGRPAGPAAPALCALALANLAAWAGGVVLLQRLRRPPGGRLRAAAPSPAGAVTAGRDGWARALLLRPLWRGPARRTGLGLVLGFVLPALPGAALLAWPQALPWWLAVEALVVLLLVTRLQTLAREEFAPLFAAALMLPLDPRRLERGRAGLCLLPLLPAALALLPGLAPVPLRGGVLLAYAVALAGACAVEVLARPREPADKAARWLFGLVLCIALASEVPA